MNEERTELSEYLPEYFRQYKDIVQIMETESAELEKIRDIHQKVKENQFVSTCSEEGITRHEKMLGMIPTENETWEERRFRLLTRWNTTIPYNYRYLLRQLDMLCGSLGYQADIDFEHQVLRIKVELVSKFMVDSVISMLDAVLPCNILYSVELLYNQHKTLSVFTHGELKEYTHRELREEVLRNV